MKRFTFLRMILLIALSIISFGYFTVAVGAFPITYQFESTSAFGDVDGNAFNNVSFKISILGDTINVDTTTDPLVPFITGLVGKINIFGGDLITPYTGTFTDTLYVFVDKLGEVVGFGNDALGLDLLDLYAPGVGLGSYDLTSYFGPITAASIFAVDQFGGIPMSFGALTFDTVDNATFAAVPEPGTMLLLGSGLIGLAGFARKKFKK